MKRILIKPKTMKAAIFTKYGGPNVLKIKKIKKPIPNNNEILIKIFATPVTSGDVRMRKADPFLARFIIGLIKPKKTILGIHLAGEIESIGKNVTLFKKGDKIFGSCGMGFGAYAEYKCLPENAVISKKPKNITFEKSAAIIFGADTALHFLKKAKIRKGQKILIYGASGAVGTAATQLAKYFGAHVSGVCSTTNLKLVKSLGAEEVIDYTQKDFTKNGKKYDIIFDAVGKTSFSKCKNSLKKNGKFIAINASLVDYFKTIGTSITGNKKIIVGVAQESLKNLTTIKKLIESKKLKSIIDKSYPLEKIAEAHRYVDKGHKKGNVVIKIV